MTKQHLLTAAVITAFASGCASTTVTDGATVRFYLDAPLCSSVIPVELSIDRSVVAVDTFRVNLASPHGTSKPFTVSAGAHVLGARFGSYVFPEKSVLFTPGVAVIDSLPFYCS